MREKGVSPPKGFYHFLIDKFLRYIEGFTKGKWSKEIKIAKKLFNSYPDARFWNQLELEFKLNSLAWFLTKDGLKFLYKQQSLFRLALPEKKEYTLGDKILGPKGKTPRKPKTIIDFIDNNEEENED